MKDDVVVKTLQTDELDGNVDRVFTEAQALKKLDHRSIIRVSTCGYADPRGKARPYLAMDYFEGVNLETYVAEEGPLSPDDLLGIAVPVAEALQAAHARGLLHRDVKPANILVRREGASWHVKLIDFGLALRPALLEGHASTAGRQAQTTMGKTIAGTLHYAAPEQMGGSDAPVGTYSDVYGFGRTCYYALFRTPEPDDEEKEILPDAWRSLLSGCTRRKVENRARDFAAVLAQLGSIRDREPEESDEPAVPTDHEQRWRTDHPAAVQCAGWYLNLLRKHYPDARQKFAKTVITLYVRNKVRAAVWPKKNDRALIGVDCLDNEGLAEATDYLIRAGVKFTTDKNHGVRFDVTPDQLKKDQGAHEWVARRLLPGTTGADGEPENAPRADILGHSATAVVRWMGRQGWDFDRAKAALARLGGQIAESTIRIQLRAGAKGERGEPAMLTPEEIAQLEG
jgi:serine/threonine protein kinase